MELVKKLKLTQFILIFGFLAVALPAQNATAMGNELEKVDKKIKIPDITKSYKGHKWWKDYSVFVKNEISKEKFKPLFNIKVDKIKGLCPKYTHLKADDKKKFWNVFFMSVAYAESGFNHNSRPCSGIMQLTCDSNARKRYGCTLCKSNSTLRQSPLIGIRCAMNIVAHWAKRGKLLNTRHPYFETLRPNSHYKKKIKPSVLKYAPEKCGNDKPKIKGLWPVKAEKIEL